LGLKFQFEGAVDVKIVLGVEDVADSRLKGKERIIDQHCHRSEHQVIRKQYASAHVCRVSCYTVSFQRN
jgi:hypothetical protein